MAVVDATADCVRENFFLLLDADSISSSDLYCAAERVAKNDMQRNFRNDLTIPEVSLILFHKATLSQN